MLLLWFVVNATFISPLTASLLPLEDMAIDFKSLLPPVVDIILQMLPPSHDIQMLLATVASLLSSQISDGISGRPGTGRHGRREEMNRGEEGRVVCLCCD